ncbi:MAG: FAD-binding oxidoreductase [Firmicutes bacterium]|nr:FAD-binding oxidoreductase [Bacillota bacterium]
MTLIKNMNEDFEMYLRDESRTVGHAERIAFPSSEEDIKAVMKECFTAGEKVTVQGGRTGIAAAAVPYGGCIVNLSKMNRVLGMRKDEDGYYLRVQPGVVLSDLRKMIASKNFSMKDWSEESKAVWTEFKKDGSYFFSPDPTETSATIGGMVNCNASGARSFLYGPTRNHVTSVTMVLTDGRTITARRGCDQRATGYEAVFTCDDGSMLKAPVPTYVMPPTKNASGYFAAKDMELIDLLIGSDGTLGVISEVEVHLLPLPKVIWGVSLLFEDEPGSLRFVDRARREVEGIASMEFFDSGALNVLRDQKAKSKAFSALPEIKDFVDTVVYVELHCDDKEQAMERLRGVADAFEAVGGKLEHSWVAMNSKDIERLMFFRHAVPESVNMLIDERKKMDKRIGKVGSDMSVPDEHLFDVVELYRSSLSEQKLQTATWGHVGNNHLHVNVLPNNMEEHARAKDMFKDWAKVICPWGGAVSAEHGVGKLKAPFLTIMYGEKHIEEMRELKRAFDPKWMLGVGNLFNQQ